MVDPPSTRLGQLYIIATNDDACNCDKSADYLVLPPMDLSDYSAIILQIDYFFGGLSYQGNTERAFIEYTTDDGDTWNQLYELSDNSEAWQQKITFDLSALAGQDSVQLAFRYNDNGG